MMTPKYSLKPFNSIYKNTSGLVWWPFWKHHLTTKEIIFLNGSISSINKHIENYHFAKCQAFIIKCTIFTHIRLAKWHDGLVPPERITTFNKLARDLSVKHDVDFVDNIHINKSFLNSSNLHLNNKGDKALGKAFCTYLKSLRQKNNVAINSFSNTNESFLFHPHYTSKRPVPVDNNWTRYLNYVYHATRM